MILRADAGMVEMVFAYLKMLAFRFFTIPNVRTTPDSIRFPRIRSDCGTTTGSIPLQHKHRGACDGAFLVAVKHESLGAMKLE